MVLHTTIEVLQVLAESEGEAWVEVIVGAPSHLVAIEAVFFQAKTGELVGVCLLYTSDAADE